LGSRRYCGRCGHAVTHADCNANSNRNSNRNCNTNSYSDRHRYGYAYGDGYSHCDVYTEANAYCAAQRNAKDTANPGAAAMKQKSACSRGRRPRLRDPIPGLAAVNARGYSDALILT
jgi:hypothetical protein